MTTDELTFLNELAPYLPSKPRTLKRVANTYRLVKTALSDVEFETFTNRDGSVAPYRICLTQLAILNTDRDRALRMIGSLDAEKDARTVGTWLDGFEEEDDGLAPFLRQVLSEQLTLQEFRDWLDRTRRYSFYL